MPNELKRPKPILELEIKEGEVRHFCLARDVDAYADKVEAELERYREALREMAGIVAELHNSIHSAEDCTECSRYRVALSRASELLGEDSK